MTEANPPQVPTEAVEEHEEDISRQTSGHSIHEQAVKDNEKAPKTYARSPSVEDGSNLYITRSHVSTHDAAAIPHHDEHYEVGDEIYNKFSHVRVVMVI
jgi:hypothetical protein